MDRHLAIRNSHPTVTVIDDNKGDTLAWDDDGNAGSYRSCCRIYCSLVKL